MTEKERLHHALHREPVDRPPCICPGGMMNMITRELMDTAGTHWPEAHISAEAMSRLAAAASTSGCFENHGLPFCMTVEAEGMGAAVDLGNMTYEPRVVGYAIESVDEWRSLKPLDFSTGRCRVVLDALRLLADRHDGIPIIGNLTGPMSLAGSLLEPSVLYKELRRKPEAARALLDFCADQLLAFGLQQIQAGADAIAISDPSGTGEILGPRLFNDYEVPALNRIITGIRAAHPAAGLIVHICGKMHKVFEPLKNVPCDALSFDAVVSLKSARAQFPHTSLMGNVSTFALESATPEKIATLTRQCRRHGADIIAPACGMGNASPLVNVQAMLRTLKEEEAHAGCPHQ